MESPSEQFGYLTVVVRTAEGTLPVENARVIIENEAGKRYELITDNSGITPKIRLSAPPIASSESAGMANPFAAYRVIVEKDGFYRQTTEHVPIFSTISAIQPINLIGKAEFADDLPAPVGSTTVQNDPQVLDRP